MIFVIIKKYGYQHHSKQLNFIKMKLEILYNGYTIIASCGSYYIEGFKTHYNTLRQAKEAVDFIMDELIYLQ